MQGKVVTDWTFDWIGPVGDEWYREVEPLIGVFYGIGVTVPPGYSTVSQKIYIFSEK